MNHRGRAAGDAGGQVALSPPWALGPGHHVMLRNLGSQKSFAPRGVAGWGTRLGCMATLGAGATPSPGGTVMGTLDFFSCPPTKLIAPGFAPWCPARSAQNKALPVLFRTVSYLSLIHKVVTSWDGVQHKPTRLIAVFPRRGALPVTSNMPDDGSVMETCNYTPTPFPWVPRTARPNTEAQTTHKAIVNPSPRHDSPWGSAAWQIRRAGGTARHLQASLGDFPGIASCSKDFAVMLSV